MQAAWVLILVPEFEGRLSNCIRVAEEIAAIKVSPFLTVPSIKDSGFDH